MASQDTSVPAADGSAAAKPTYDYTAGSFAAPLAKSEMDRRSLTLAYGPEWVFMSGLHSVRAMYVPMTLPNRRQSFGVDAQRRYNLFCVQEKTLMFAVGNILHSLNTETGEKTYFQGFRGGSIGAIAVCAEVGVDVLPHSGGLHYNRCLHYC